MSSIPQSDPNGTLPAAHKALPRLIGAAREGRLVLCLDYDGTLAAIAPRPELARITPEMRDALAGLARHVPVAIISGRDLKNVRAMVGLSELVYAGSHGMDIAGPGGLSFVADRAADFLPDLDAAENELAERTAPFDGVEVERKRFAIAVHYRRAAVSDVGHVHEIVDSVLARHARLRPTGGRKVFELRPAMPWDKGRAVAWLLNALGHDGEEMLPVFIGDDVTDEDAFKALAGRGVSILVRGGEHVSAASYALDDVDDVRRFLAALLDGIERTAGGADK